MGIAQELLVAFLSEHVAPRLREQGFRKKAATFWLQEGGNWGVLNFQRSDASTAGEVIFTGNVGVACERLRTHTSAWRAGARPTPWDCHLELRLGELLPDRPPADYWWVLDSATDTERLAADFGRYLDVVVPLLRTLLPDDALREHWWARLEAGRLAGVELGYLRILAEAAGPDEAERLDAELERQQTPQAKAEWRRRAEEQIAVAKAAARNYPDRYIRTPRRDVR